MGFRTGLILGFAAGYVLGTKAGRERYEQIRRTAEKAWGSDPAEKMRSTASGAAGDVGHKAVAAVKQLRHRGDGAEDLLRDVDPLVTATPRGDGNF